MADNNPVVLEADRHIKHLEHQKKNLGKKKCSTQVLSTIERNYIFIIEQIKENFFQYTAKK